MLTNPWHHHFFTGFHPAGPEGGLLPVLGWAFWLHSAYIYSLLTVSFVLVVRARRQAPRTGGRSTTGRSRPSPRRSRPTSRPWPCPTPLWT
nr:hypothetical protein GCM10020093_065600 [Planobispora longispora]